MSNETRKLPTRPGWWWRRGNHGPYIEEVDGDQNHGLFLAIDGSDVVDDGTWLAPIPGPAVLAALAEYGNALIGAGDSGTGKLADGYLAAWQQLADTIRAERDGAA